MIREQEYFHLLETEYLKLEEDRARIENERLDASIAETELELDGLKETFATADAAKKAFDKKKT